MESKRKIQDIGLQLLKWVISNTIWTIITLIIPFALLIPAGKNLIQNISDKTYSISLIDLFLIILFMIIEISIIILLVHLKENFKEDGRNSNEERQKDNNNIFIDYNSLDYYFGTYHKHLTVYKNGNGILINTFTLIINNINSVTEFKREININDSQITTRFPKLSRMKKTKINDRFHEFGFWYRCLNNKDLIKSVREYYWSEDSKGIDTVAQSNDKDLKWIMEMNPSSIQIGKPYKIVYIMSIPKMFPLKDGVFDESIANIKGTHGRFQSKFAVKHIINNFKYTVSFENDLYLHTKPTGNITQGNEKINLQYDNDNNIIYDKYIFNTSSPDCNSVINIEWNFKEKKLKNGGS